MLTHIIRKSFLIGAVVLAVLPSWAAGEKCEQSFAPQKIERALPGSTVNIDGLQLTVARSVPPTAGNWSSRADLLPTGFYSAQPTYEAQPGSLAAKFTNLAQSNSLIDQMDRRLGYKGLLVPNGGLCASTCGVNVMHAIASYSHQHLKNHFYANSDAFIEQIVNRVWQRFYHDARMGLNYDKLSVAMEEVAQTIGMQIRTRTFILYENYQGFNEASLETNENTIALIAVRTEKGAHALVLTGYDRQTRTAYFNDPNQPWTIFQAVVTPTYEEGIPTLKLNGLRFGFGSHVGNLTQVLYVTTTPPVQRPAPRPYTDPQPYRDTYSRPAPAPQPYNDQYSRPAPAPQPYHNEPYTRPAPAPNTDYSRYIGKRVLVQTRNGQQTTMVVTLIRKTSYYFYPPGVYGLQRTSFGESDVQLDFEDIVSIREI